jgi:hypothetical protein
VKAIFKLPENNIKTSFKLPENNIKTSFSIPAGGGTYDYERLRNKPSINDVELIGNKTSEELGLASLEQGLLAQSALQPNDNISELANDVGYITISTLDGYATENWVGQQGFLTSSDLSGYATETWVNNQGYLTSINSSDVINALGYTPYNSTNPSGFITNVVNDLTNYYLKSETYTKLEVQQLIASIPKFTVLVVQELPLTGQPMTLYLVPKDGASPDVYNEYIWIEADEDYELIGNTAIDLTNYVQFTDLATVATTGDYDDLIDKPIPPVGYGTSSTAGATATKVVSIPEITELNVGQVIIVKPSTTSTVANSKIKLNDFEAYNMRYNNANITTSTDSIVWTANVASMFIFDGTYWQFLGHGLDNNTNTTYASMSVDEGITGTATATRSLTATNLKQIIQGTKLKGLVTTNDADVVASDSITIGIGKLQAQSTETKNILEDKQDKITDLTDIRNGASAGATALQSLSDYQPLLESGANIKTINNQSLLGSGNIDIQSGGTVDQTFDGTSANAQSGVAIAGELVNYMPLNSSSDIDIYANSINFNLSDKLTLNSAPVLCQGWNSLADNVDSFGINIDTDGLWYSRNYNDSFYVDYELSAMYGYEYDSNDTVSSKHGIEVYGNGINFSNLNYETTITIPANGLLALNGHNIITDNNLKTINNQSIIGSGNINISGGTTYTAGNGIDITNNTISIDNSVVATQTNISDMATRTWVGNQGYLTSSALTNYVTTDTVQDITAKKTFIGDKAILFKQATTADKLGFTLYNTSNAELAAFEFRPSTIGSSALFNLNLQKTSANYVGFRYHGTNAINVACPKVATAGNYYIPINFTNGTNTVTSNNVGTVNISTLIPTIATSVNSGSTNAQTVGAKLFYDTVGNIETLLSYV